eukprot:7067858-Prymnesium_polylepis.1
MATGQGSSARALNADVTIGTSLTVDTSRASGACAMALPSWLSCESTAASVGSSIAASCAFGAWRD